MACKMATAAVGITGRQTLKISESGLLNRRLARGWGERALVPRFGFSSGEKPGTTQGSSKDAGCEFRNSLFAEGPWRAIKKSTGQ